MVRLLRVTRWFLLLACTVFATPLVAKAAAPPRHRFTVQEARIPLPKDHGTLDAYVYVPEGQGPFPAVILNHGSPRTAQGRSGRARYSVAGGWFAERGFVVAVPSRRGYGQSTGPFAEGFGSCDRPDYLKAGRATANDIGAVLRWLRERPDVDARKLLAVGQSAGGFGVLALAARNPSGLIGVINFAGGRGSPSNGKNCGPDVLMRALGRYGEESRVPSLWAYAQNDQSFPPRLSRKFHAAYMNRTRSRGTFILFPEYGADGHSLFGAADGPALWGPTVADFLRTLGFRVAAGPESLEQRIDHPEWVDPGGESVP